MQDLGNEAENHSKICERQFPLDWFVIEPHSTRSIGYSRLQLKKDATTIIFLLNTFGSLRTLKQIDKHRSFFTK